MRQPFASQLCHRHRAVPPRVLLLRPALATPWAHIEHVVGLPTAHFKALYLSTMTSLLDYVQLLCDPIQAANVPFVDTALVRAARAVSLARGRLLPPGRAMEEIKDHQHVWRYGLFTAQLLRGVEQVALGQVVYRWGRWSRPQRWAPLGSALRDSWTTRWYGVTEPLPAPSASLCLPLAERIMPARGLAWLAADRDAYLAWTRTLRGESSPLETAAAPITHDEPTVDGAADVATPVHVPLTDTATREPSGRQRGEAFVEWLRRSIADGSLSVDQPSSLLFRMPDNNIALRTPQTFQRYAVETGEDWKAIQQAVLNMHRHCREGTSNFTRLSVRPGRAYPVVVFALTSIGSSVDGEPL